MNKDNKIKTIIAIAMFITFILISVLAIELYIQYKKANASIESITPNTK